MATRVVEAAEVLGSRGLSIAAAAPSEIA